jgi:hypothetical protein
VYHADARPSAAQLSRTAVGRQPEQAGVPRQLVRRGVGAVEQCFEERLAPARGALGQLGLGLPVSLHHSLRERVDDIERVRRDAEESRELLRRPGPGARQQSGQQFLPGEPEGVQHGLQRDALFGAPPAGGKRHRQLVGAGCARAAQHGQHPGEVRAGHGPQVVGGDDPAAAVRVADAVHDGAHRPRGQLGQLPFDLPGQRRQHGALLAAPLRRGRGSARARAARDGRFGGRRRGC